MKKLLIAVMVSGVCAGTLHAQGDKLVLDETSYCRAYVQFGVDRLDPASLKGKKNGAEHLSPKQWTAIQREVRRIHRMMGKKWDKAAWMDEAYVLLPSFQGSGDRGQPDTFIGVPPPPTNWMRPEFDEANGSATASRWGWESNAAGRCRPPTRSGVRRLFTGSCSACRTRPRRATSSST